MVRLISVKLHILLYSLDCKSEHLLTHTDICSHVRKILAELYVSVQHAALASLVLQEARVRTVTHADL